jgi:hypothetical protein
MVTPQSFIFVQFISPFPYLPMGYLLTYGLFTYLPIYLLVNYLPIYLFTIGLLKPYMESHKII